MFKTLSGEEFKKIRQGMGLTLTEMADWLFMVAKWSERSIRRWEDGTNPIPGPVVKALDLAGQVSKEGIDINKRDD